MSPTPQEENFMGQIAAKNPYAREDKDWGRARHISGII